MNPFAPECETLVTLARSAREQLDALRDGTPETFEAAAGRTLDIVAQLDRQRRERERLTAVPGAPPLGPDARDDLKNAALEAKDACDALELALEYAAVLGRDLISAWHHLSKPPTAHVYTAHGTVGPPVRR